MNVLWLPDACDDVEAIAARRTAWSTEASGIRLAREIVARGQQLAEFPWSGRVIPEFQLEQLREVPEQGYRIIYEVFPDRIEVFGVISSRQSLAE